MFPVNSIEEWDAAVDQAADEKPWIIEIKGRRMLLVNFEILEIILSRFEYTVDEVTATDGSVTLYWMMSNYVQTIVHAATKEQALKKMAKSIRQYAENFYNDSEKMKADYAQKYIPYIFKALILNDVKKIREHIVCTPSIPKDRELSVEGYKSYGQRQKEKEEKEKKTARMKTEDKGLKLIDILDGRIYTAYWFSSEFWFTANELLAKRLRKKALMSNLDFYVVYQSQEGSGNSCIVLDMGSKAPEKHKFIGSLLSFGRGVSISISIMGYCLLDEKSFHIVEEISAEELDNKIKEYKKHGWKGSSESINKMLDYYEQHGLHPDD